MKNEANAADPVLTASDIPPRRSLRKTILNPLVCSVAAAIGIFGGISCLAAGVICVVIHSVVAADEVFSQAGTTLLILGIAMLLVGSMFLDEVAGKDK